MNTHPRKLSRPAAAIIDDALMTTATIRARDLLDALRRAHEKGEDPADHTADELATDLLDMTEVCGRGWTPQMLLTIVCDLHTGNEGLRRFVPAAICQVKRVRAALIQRTEEPS